VAGFFHSVVRTRIGTPSAWADLRFGREVPRFDHALGLPAERSDYFLSMCGGVNINLCSALDTRAQHAKRFITRAHTRHSGAEFTFLPAVSAGYHVVTIFCLPPFVFVYRRFAALDDCLLTTKYSHVVSRKLEEM